MDSRRENWAGARTAELVPSLPAAAGTMRSDSWFRVSLEGSASVWVFLKPPREANAADTVRSAQLSCIRSHTQHPREEEPGTCTDGPGPGTEGQAMALRQGKGCVCVCAYAQLLTPDFSSDMSLPAELRSKRERPEGEVKDNLMTG